MKGCFNFKVFDNIISANMLHDSAVILRSKIFNLLEEVSQKKLLYYTVIGGLIGMVIGGGIVMVSITIMLRWV